MKMKRKIQYGPLAAALAIPLAVGGFSAFLTREGMEYFKTVAQPLLSPPSWLFPVAWTILYLLMGAASYLVWVSGVSEKRRDRALTVYGLSLAANFLWPIVFFTARLYLAAFLLLLVLWVLVVITALLFSCIDDRAGKLMIPYIVWLSFAAYLNLGVWLLNR
jgi:tryptophan-rich sensory protein